MVCKVNSIFDEIFKMYIHTQIKKSGFTDFVKEILKKMIALYNLRKKRTILTLGEDELLAEMVRSYPCFHDKT